MKIKILILAILFPFIGNAQFKIGNIEVDKRTFNEYIDDCYEHPDTIYYLPWSKENKEQIKLSIGRVSKTVEASYDTIYNRQYNGDIVAGSWGSEKEVEEWIESEKQKDIKSGIKVIKFIDKYTYLTNDFLFPRKPTEEDFIKWYHKQNK